MSEQIPFPERLVTAWDIVKGMGQVVLHALTDQFRHEGVSEHFVHDPLVSPLEHSSASLTPEARQGWVEQQRAAETALRASQEALNGE